MTIRELLTRVQGVDIDKAINAAFDLTLVNLEDINRERMMDGQKSDGLEMPHYSRTSVVVYGYPPGPIKLKDTGAFQAGIEVVRSGNILSTGSTDDKSDMLEERYGPKIFGTGGSYKQQYLNEHLRPALNRQINLLLGLKFGK